MSKSTDMVTSRRSVHLTSDSGIRRDSLPTAFIWRVIWPLNKTESFIVCYKLKILVRKRETKHAIFTETQMFGIFFSFD